jgi:hypothetical protein
MDGQIKDLLREAHDSQVTRVACRVHAFTQPFHTFPRTTRASALVWWGAVGKACRLAFFYGTESDPIVDATFLAKLTRTTPHSHVPLPPSSYKSAFVPIPIKAVTSAFTCMPKKSAPHKDGLTWELFMDMENRPKTANLLRKVRRALRQRQTSQTTLEIPIHNDKYCLSHVGTYGERHACGSQTTPHNHRSAHLSLIRTCSFGNEHERHCGESDTIQPVIIWDTKRRSDCHHGMNNCTAI